MEVGKEFTAINDEGNEIPCTVILTFVNPETGKHYLVYTDGKVDANGNTDLLASIYNPAPDDAKLYPIETEEEWELVRTICRQHMKLAD